MQPLSNGLASQGGSSRLRNPVRLALRSQSDPEPRHLRGEALYAPAQARVPPWALEVSGCSLWIGWSGGHADAAPVERIGLPGGSSRLRNPVQLALCSQSDPEPQSRGN